MKKFLWLIVSILVILALTLRLYKFENNSGFDWDQNRDYGEVQKIAKGQLVILGPVAKGSGGFYLGSLYYYLLYPAYFLMSHSLYALPVTSIFIDSVIVGCIFLLLHKLIGAKSSFAISLLWITSSMMIGASRVSWNVALVPIWSLLTIYSMVQVIDRKSASHFYLLGFLLGLTLHIHVAVIPVIPIFAIFYLRKLSFSLRDWVIMAICMLIPLLPLILFDFKHGFLNAHLLRDQLGTQAASHKGLWPLLTMSMIKLGKVVNGIFLAKFVDNFYLGIITIVLAIKTTLFNQKTIYKLAGLFVMVSTVLIIALGDYGFPEYYFAPAYLAIFIVYISSIMQLPKILGYLTIFTFLALNLTSYSTAPSPFALKYKYDLVNTLKDFHEPIDISYQFDPGRDGGFGYLVKLQGIQTDRSSRTKILLTDKTKTPLYISGELARDLTQIGNFKSAIYIVQ